MRLLLIIIGLLWGSLAQAGELLVIASPDVPINSISVEQLADIYKAKKTFWESDMQVVPVNREATSGEREHFSRAVFNLSTQELGEYWNRLSFQGKRLPIVQSSDQAVLGFVRSVPGAIGYIGAGQQPAGVKVLLRLQ
jgi:ABC-type phosphate transport system substrate-binding protein